MNGTSSLIGVHEDDDHHSHHQHHHHHHYHRLFESRDVETKENPFAVACQNYALGRAVPVSMEHLVGEAIAADYLPGSRMLQLDPTCRMLVDGPHSPIYRMYRAAVNPDRSYTEEALADYSEPDSLPAAAFVYKWVLGIPQWQCLRTNECSRLLALNTKFARALLLKFGFNGLHNWEAHHLISASSRPRSPSIG